MDNFTNATLSDLNDLPGLSRLPVIKVGGIVSAVNHRTTKKGNPFGVITLEDYNDTQTMYLFSQDYIKFKEYFVPGWFLFIQGSVKPRWHSEELEFKINDIAPLPDIREKYTKGIQLFMPLSAINRYTIDELKSIANDYPGSCSLKMQVTDQHENRMLNLSLLARTTKVDPTDELLNKLEELEGMSYKVLT
ncbi:MAG: OB-fold nucleic acid binding domain-containing protein [Bacteroidota bacterium]